MTLITHRLAPEMPGLVCHCNPASVYVLDEPFTEDEHCDVRRPIVGVAR